MEFFGVIIISIIVAFVIFLICRELMCWYFKINKLVGLMEEQNSLLKIIANKYESLDEETDEDESTLNLITFLFLSFFVTSRYILRIQ